MHRVNPPGLQLCPIFHWVMTVDSTRNLILSLFPANEQGNRSLQELADKAEVFTRAGTFRLRLDAFVDLFSWLRVTDHRISVPLAIPGEPAVWMGAEWKRERVWLSVLAASEEIRDRYHAGIVSILEETDGVSLFAQSGLPTDRGLLPETIDRLFRIVLPAPREETDLSKLFLRLFPTKREVERFFNMPPQLLEQLVSLSVPMDNEEVWERPVGWLLDAFCLLGARVQGLGLSEKLRIRSQPLPVRESPFYLLSRSGDLLIDALRHQQDIAPAAQAWKATVGECRMELKAIVAHLDARGVSLDVVYALDVIEKSLLRMEIIGGVLVAQVGPAKQVTAERLLRDVIRGRLEDGSLWNLMHNSFRLLAKKIVEWAGKTGEHYITSNREEYTQMWRAALGGGFLTVGTAAIKLLVTHRGLPPFVEGFLAGLNYAVSFVLMQNFHLVLATKQPSMTGAALARIIDHCRDSSKSDELVAYIQRIVRSQLAAALGNILAVCAGSIVFSLIWREIFRSHFLSEETAWYNIHSLDPIHTGTIFCAMLTGLILWLSSIAGGWIENWAVYHQLPKAIAEHRLGSAFKPERVASIADFFSKNIAGWGGSIALGFMLGMTPVIGHFFGLPLDVRHVTLSSGTLALGVTSIGFSLVGTGALLLAILGVACTFVMNLSVSFYLALRLALRAQDVSRKDHLDIWRTLGRQLVSSPREFFLPPARGATPTVELTH
jgi:site-specific recombinase